MRYHGVLVDVGGVGVLLAGPSGAGTSECALELIARGNRLVDDDAVELTREGDRVIGRASAAGDVGTWLDGYLFALSGPIYAGTNEIQRNIIAERILGMPR